MKSNVRRLMAVLALLLFLGNTGLMQVQAVTVNNDAQYGIDSNNNSGWPQGANVGCETAVLMDANSGEILYNKGMDEIRYPASITKVMTALLAIENTASVADEQVTFTATGLADQAEGTNINMQVGEVLTMEQCLYVMMIQSANDVASQIAEHVGGTIPQFVDMMNAKAQELGCKNTHFVNPNGLPNEEHYSTAYDFALIFREALKSDLFRTIIGTLSYQLPATNMNGTVRNFSSHIAIACPGVAEYVDYCLGGKSGLTVVAKNTLVTGAQKDGVTLVACVMRGEVGQIYGDSKALYEYGYGQFDKITFDEGYALVPKGVTADALTAQEQEDGYNNYYYNDILVGRGKDAPEPTVTPTPEPTETMVEPTEADTQTDTKEQDSGSHDIAIYIIMGVLAVGILVSIILIIVGAKHNKQNRRR